MLQPYGPARQQAVEHATVDRLTGPDPAHPPRSAAPLGEHVESCTAVERGTVGGEREDLEVLIVQPRRVLCTVGVDDLDVGSRVLERIHGEDPRAVEPDVEAATVDLVVPHEGAHGGIVRRPPAVRTEPVGLRSLIEKVIVELAPCNAPAASINSADLTAAQATGLELTAGRPEPRLVVVDLSTELSATFDRAVPCPAPAPPGSIVVGVADAPLPSDADHVGATLDLTLLPAQHEDPRVPWQVGVPDVPAALAAITETLTSTPAAAHTLVDLLRLTAVSSVRDGLVAESLAYSMLMTGEEHARWLAGRRRRPIPPSTDPVTLHRDSDTLTVTLNRPERHNAFGRAVRDGLVDALDLVALDDSIDRVRLVGAGPSFCSGGDLDEFGLSDDVTTAHLVRIDRRVAARLHAVRDRVEVTLHGACVGAGIELASFAAHVRARPTATILLPEVAMGLVPGAGGTVGITRRIGRWRTAYVALSGAPLPVDAALRWGLVDDVVA